MAWHSRSKNGVASLAYVPAIHDFLAASKTWMRGSSPRMKLRFQAIEIRSNEGRRLAAFSLKKSERSVT